MSHVGKRPFIISNLFCYIEYSYLSMFSVNRIFKLSLLNMFRPVIRIKQLLILHSTFSNFSFYKKFLGLSRNFIYYIVMGLFFFYKIKLQLIGLGYKFFIKSNFLVLKIGSSHLYKIKVPLCIKVKKKKLNLILYSYDFLRIRQFAFFIKALKLPGIYHGKGIKFKYEKLIRKEGKKNQI